MKFAINGAITLRHARRRERRDPRGGRRRQPHPLRHDDAGGQQPARLRLPPAQPVREQQHHQKAVDALGRGFDSKTFSNLHQALLNVDQYMALADFASYSDAQRQAGAPLQRTRKVERDVARQHGKGRHLRGRPLNPRLREQHLARKARQRYNRKRKRHNPHAACKGRRNSSGAPFPKRSPEKKPQGASAMTFFNSRNPIYRSPTGAVQAGTRVHFKITVPRSMACSAAYLLIQDADGRTVCCDMFWCGMNGDDHEWWECHFAPQHAGLCLPLRAAHLRGHSVLKKDIGGEARSGGSRLAAHGVRRGLQNAGLARGRRAVPDLPRPLLQLGREKAGRPLRAHDARRLVRAARMAAERRGGDHEQRFFRRRPQGHRAEARLPRIARCDLHLPEPDL